MSRLLSRNISGNLDRAIWSNTFGECHLRVLSSTAAVGSSWHLFRTILQQHLKQCLERAEERVNWLIKIEDIPFSLNTHYLADYRSKFLSHFRAAREKYERADIVKAIKEYTTSSPVFSTATTSSGRGREVTSTPQPTGVAKVLAGLAEMGMSGVTAYDLPKLLPPDPMEPALAIMADVRAYFQGLSSRLPSSPPFDSSHFSHFSVAYKRFADNVPLAIDFELVRGVERDALIGLYANLGVNGVNGQRICEELAQESMQVADRRADLRKKLERLEGASVELLTVGIAG